jgi:indole-3-glycerol phosphate synthase
MGTQTGTVLDRIASRTVADLAERRAKRSLAALAATASRLPAAIPFTRALREGTTGVIAEVKRASPSKGLIAPEVDAGAVARDYLAAGVSAISVLTDAPFFQGSLADLSQVADIAHRDSSPRPVLRKDFLIDPYQVAEARASGADAVLLIVALLQGERLREMLAAVRSYGLEALVEVHDEPELGEALKAGAEVIGINNRDLHTFTVDLATTDRLIPIIPTDRTIVAESGIHSREDLRRLAEAGAHAVLIGESLMTAPDRQAVFRELVR